MLVRQGKVLYVGSSNFAGWQIVQGRQQAARRNFLGLVSEQSLYNLTMRTIELEVLPACRASASASSRGARSRAGALAGVLGDRGKGRRFARLSSARRSKAPPQIEAWERFCRERGEESGGRRARVDARESRRDGADHRPAHDRAADRVAARARDPSRPAGDEAARRDLAGPGRRAPGSLRLGEESGA
jgi:hypothetical protein